MRVVPVQDAKPTYILSKITVRGVKPTYKPLWKRAESMGGFVTPYGPGTTVEVIMNSKDALVFAEEANGYAESVVIENIGRSGKAYAESNGREASGETGKGGKS